MNNTTRATPTLAEVVDGIARSIAVSNHANQTYIMAARTTHIQMLLDEVVRLHPEITIPEVTFN